MFKILLFTILFFYSIYRLSGFVMRIFSLGSNGTANKNPRGGNVRVDKAPKTDQKNFDGGEYIDYEEVK